MLSNVQAFSFSYIQYQVCAKIAVWTVSGFAILTILFEAINYIKKSFYFGHANFKQGAS